MWNGTGIGQSQPGRRDQNDEQLQGGELSEGVCVCVSREEG